MADVSDPDVTGAGELPVQAPAVPIGPDRLLVGPPPLPRDRLPPRSAGGIDLLIAVAVIWGIEFVMGFAASVGGAIGPKGFNPVVFFVIMVVSACVTVLVSYARVCRKYGRSFSEGFAIRPVSRRTLAVSLLIGVVGAALAAVVVLNFGKTKTLIIQQEQGLLPLALGMILIVTLPPIEELYYRGFVYPVVRKGTGATGAVILVTLWFTAAHWLQFVVDWIAVPIILVIGAVFTIQRQLTRSLVPSIVTHWSYNATLAAVVLVMKIAEQS